MNPFIATFLIFITSLLPLRAQQAVGFIERFALADDRTEVLKELIPGTEEAFFYTALHFQNQGNRAEFLKTMQDWNQRYPASDRSILTRRQALIDYSTDPKATLDLLKLELNPNLSHQRQIAEEQPDLPNSLDQNLISAHAFFQNNTASRDNLDTLSLAALENLVRTGAATNLSDGQRRSLLARLERPDVTGLKELILKELQSKHTQGFGAFPIHNALLGEQLDTLSSVRPELLSQQNFVNIRLAKWQPNSETDVETDLVARSIWLKQLWDFAASLPPAMNSVKAHILYQRLDLGRLSGTYDAELLLSYLKLPRPLPYINPQWRDNTPEDWHHPVDLNADFSSITNCPPVQQDEPIIRDYLLRLFTDPNIADYNAYLPWLEENFLRTAFAEAKITSNQNENGQFTPWITSSDFSTLRDRVDIHLDPANPRVFGVNDKIDLLVSLKNTPDLTLKIFEINTAAWYETQHSEIGTDLDLDGLIPQTAQSLPQSTPPIQRTTQKIPLDAIPQKPGVWIVELIANGRSSRALIRRGSLQYLPRPSAQGTVFIITDDSGNPLPKAFATFENRTFSPDEKTGEILIPHTTDPAEKPVILHDGNGFATRENIPLTSETYTLTAGFHVDHESLLPGTTAILALRPRLMCLSTPAPNSLINKIKLTISATSLNGIPTTTVLENLKLTNNEELLVEFQVPNRLNSLTFNLTGEVRNQTTGTDDPVHASQTLKVNGIEASPELADVHLAKNGNDWLLDYRGKNGEQRADRALYLTLKHRDYQETKDFTLKTDASGRINLGPLFDIQHIQTRTDSGLTRTWPLTDHQRNAPYAIHATVGEIIHLPWFNGNEADETNYSLLEVRSGSFTANAAQHAKVNNSQLEISGLNPGDYLFLDRRDNTSHSISISPGKRVKNHILSHRRILESTPLENLSITKLAIDGTDLLIQLAGTRENTRLHITATRYQPTQTILDQLGRLPQHNPLSATLPVPISQYLSGRDIGEEYRYILERQKLKTFTGVHLPRPGLILNPWTTRDTDAGEQIAQIGASYDRLQEMRKRQTNPNPIPPSSSSPIPSPDIIIDQSASFNWLAEPSATAYNLKPDQNQTVRIPIDQLRDTNQITLTAIDSRAAISQNFALPAQQIKTRDLRLPSSLDPTQDFSHVDEALALPSNKPFVIQDALSSEYETYTNLSQVFSLLQALNPDPTLSEFAFILDWPSFTPDKKRELYSRYASHELNFFLSHKDPEFFQTNILPYITQKKDRTFLDDYLLGADLTKYLESWQHSRLNIVERILLGRRIKEHTLAEQRHIKDLQNRVPINRDADRLLLETALGGLKLTGNSPQKEGAIQNQPTDAQRDEKLELTTNELTTNEQAASVMAESPQVPQKAAGARILSKKSAENKDTTQLEANFAFESSDSADDKPPTDALHTPTPFFRPLEKTKEWAETNYYNLRITAHNADLIDVNRFWADFSQSDPNAPFLSPYIIEATGNLSEMILALALTDLPFASQAAEPHTQLNDGNLTITPKTPILLFQQQIRPANKNPEAPKLLVSQNFYRLDERFIEIDGETIDRFITKEFLTGIAYGAQLVITNPTSSIQKLDVLFQIPEGAIPLNGGKPTHSHPLRIKPFHTLTIDTTFYFPNPGDFKHYPTHVSKDATIVASTAPFPFHVVNTPTHLDTESWEFVSQRASNEDVISYLNTHNIIGLDLTRIAWRVRESADFFHQIITLLNDRRTYNPTLYAYAILHNHPAAIRTLLLHESNFLDRCGPTLITDLITIDPIDRRQYEQLEYEPLVNSRTHRLGTERRIMNTPFWQQYQAYLNLLSHQPTLTDQDQLAITYYLLLQDRIEEAQTHISKIKTTHLQIQRDYASAWLAMAHDKPADAQTIANTYKTYPITKWRDKFTRILTHIDESNRTITDIDSTPPTTELPEPRDDQHNTLANQTPVLHLTLDGKSATLTTRNLTTVTVNYYLMDLEFLFSSNPFVNQDNSRFSIITPNKTATLTIDNKAPHTKIQLPDDIKNQNVLIEVVSGAQRKAIAVFANNLRADFMEPYGILQVADAETNQPTPHVYVKVYALVEGQPKFHKDGYTDSRGKFDYVSLNEGPNNATKFSVLLISPKHGALVKELLPPTR